MALQFECGTFTKSVDAAPVDQTVTLADATITPKALILFTIGNTTADAFVGGHMTGIGVSVGATAADMFSAATASQDNVADSNCSKRAAAKALTIVQWAESVVAECVWKSVAAGSFTVTWDTNDANAYHIGYIVLGGTDITAQEVLAYTEPTATGVTSFAAAGATDYDVAFLIGVAQAGALPQTAAGESLYVAALDRSGGQWSLSIRGDDAGASSNTAVADNAHLAASDYDANNTVELEGRLEMTATGFKGTYNDAAPTAYNRGALLIKGGTWNVGSFIKPTTAAPFTQTVEIAPGSVTPTGLITCGRGTGANYNAGSGGATNAILFFGCYDGTHEVGLSIEDQDAAATMNVDAILKTTKVIVRVNNFTPTVNAECDGGTFAAGSFGLSWTTNDANFMRCHYVACGNSPTGGGGALIDAGLVIT